MKLKLNRGSEKIARRALFANLVITIVYMSMFVWTAFTGSGWWPVWMVATGVAIVCLSWTNNICEDRWGNKDKDAHGDGKRK